MGRSLLARVFGVTARHFDEQYARYAPTTAKRKVGREVEYHGRTLLDAWCESQKGKPVDPTGGDPLLADGDSPGLERYRNAKADLAEMERDRQKGELVPRSELEPVLMGLAGVMRRAGETLARRFGNEAAAVVNEATEEWAMGCAGLLGHDADADAGAEAGGGDTDPAAADAP